MQNMNYFYCIPGYLISTLTFAHDLYLHVIMEEA